MTLLRLNGTFSKIEIIQSGLNTEFTGHQQKERIPYARSLVKKNSNSSIEISQTYFIFNGTFPIRRNTDDKDRAIRIVHNTKVQNALSNYLI